MEYSGNIPNTNVQVIETPGHAHEHCSLLIETEKGKIVVAGDVITNIDTGIACSGTVTLTGDIPGTDDIKTVTCSPKLPPPYIDNVPQEPSVGENISFYLENNQNRTMYISQVLIYDANDSIVYGSGPITDSSGQTLSLLPGDRVLVFSWDQEGNSGAYHNQQISSGEYKIRITYSYSGTEDAKYIGKIFTITSD